MAHPRALTAAKERKVVEGYQKGKSSTELAEKFGVHRSTVVEAVKRAGITPRKAGGSKPRKKVAARKAA